MTELLATYDEIQELDLSGVNRTWSTSLDFPEMDSVIEEYTKPCFHPTQGFDYGEISSAVVEEAEATVEKIRNRQCASILDTGHDLNDIKDKLQHGSFGNWLKFHFNMTERTAQNYMSAANAFGASPNVVAHLPASTIYKLASKDAPPELRRSVIIDIDAGTAVDSKDIEAKITVAKTLRQQERNVERKAKADTTGWLKLEKTLKGEEKSADEIAAARKLWDAGGLQARKHSESVEEADKPEIKDHVGPEEGRGSNDLDSEGTKAANFLKMRLKDDFEKFRILFLQIDHASFRRAIEAV